MKKFTLLLLSTLMLASVARAGTYTAASCSQADVDAVINGPTHTAIDGDIINVPAGTCTLTAGVVVTNIGISIIGAGQGTTIIDDNYTGAAAFKLLLTYGNSLSRISAMTIQPHTGTTYGYTGGPITALGTCTASGCPNVRFDHLTFPSSWSGKQVPGDEAVRLGNVFGVLDHNTVGDVPGSGNGVFLVSVSHASWKGVGSYGDNSWASADTFGTEEAVYVEDNTFNYAAGTDSDGTPAAFEDVGGGRIVCRFNTFNHVTGGGACGNHGTESSGRMRGGRQLEFYGNSTNATSAIYGLLGVRSGPAIAFGNTFDPTGGGSTNNFVATTAYREWQTDAFSLCIVGPYDVQDGRSTAWSGTIASLGTGTLSVAGTPWSANAYAFDHTAQTGTYYWVYDTTSGQAAGIESNTTSQLTLSWYLSVASYSGLLGGTAFNASDGVTIFGTTIYAAGTHTGSSGVSVLTDVSKSWTANEWVNSGDAYSVLDVTTGHAYQIGANTATTVTAHSSPSPAWTWTNGDEYVILRSSRCMDQGAVGYGNLLANAVPVPTPTTETVDPIYEWNDVESGGSPTAGYVVSGSLNIVANRDYYSGGANTVQVSSSSPFDGTTGVGFGTLANRPTTCTAGVGYFATDQGTWNQSGNGFGQGVLYTCTATNTWSASYTPYTYPHPLTGNPPAATPTYAPTPGTYGSTQSVTISTTSSGAVICYTTDGSTPATDGTTGCTTGTLYSGAISVSVTTTFKAVAGGTGYGDSAVTPPSQYTINSGGVVSGVGGGTWSGGTIP